MPLFNELKRRSVFRVGSAYVVVGWLVLQVADVLLNNLEMPGWVFDLILISLLIGFPLALLLAWVYEFTPEGIRKESEFDEAASMTRRHGHKLNYVVIGGLLLAVVYYALIKDRVGLDTSESLERLVNRPSVIVLPFENIGGDKNKDYLAFGFTDEVITGLQRTKEFPVVSRYASLEFRGSGMSANEYAANLGASYRVEGSLSLTDDGIRVLATLSGAGDEQVWAERFQRVSGNDELLDVADELVAKISSAVWQSEVRRVQQIPHPPADAWEQYILGLSVVMAFEPEKYEQARRHLDQAVKLAPDMAEAWAAIGDLEVDHYVSQPLQEETDFDRLKEITDYFRKSHELSPFNGSACGCLGFMLSVLGQADEARAVFKQALEANPLSSGLRLDYATFLLWDGQYEEAVEHTEIALKLGIYGEGRAIAWLTRSTVEFARGNSDAALEAVNRALFISKGPFVVPASIALLYLLGEDEDAGRLLREMQQIYPGISPKNPMVYVMLKPIDDILARQNANIAEAGPNDVDEIYDLLSDSNS
jgi:TolB-like protein/Tfp pilus assembly protein PilF